MAKKIDHRGRGGHRVAIFSVPSVPSVRSVVFPKPKFQEITKSLASAAGLRGVCM